jgi:TRAP-type C4-dicarboxylate transport system permease small subunit
MKWLSYAVNQAANGANRLATWGLVVTGITMSVVVFLQIFFRFVIYVPFPWSEECARYLMIWMGMLGSAVALRYGRHIGVTVLVERMPQQVYRYVIMGIQLVMIGFLVIVAKEGITLAVFNFSQRSPALEIPMFYPYIAIPVGAALMILELCADLLHEFFPTPAGAHRTIISRVLEGSD